MEDIQLNSIQNHLTILFKNSTIGNNVQNADLKLSHVKKTFKYLDQVHPFISLILQTVAASKDFKIIFDFTKKLDLYLDPNEEQAKRRSLLSARDIYVRAGHQGGRLPIR